MIHFFRTVLVLVGITVSTAAWSQIEKPADTAALVKEWYMKGMLEKVEGNFALAEAYFGTCIRLDPSCDAAYYELSGLAYMEGNNVQALTWVTYATDLKPNEKWYLQRKAELQFKTGYFIAAAETYQQLIVLYPDEQNFYLDKSEVLIHADSLKDAIETLDIIERNFGVDDRWLFLRQAIYLKQGKIKEAEQDVLKLIEFNPDNIGYYFDAIELYLLNNQPDKAIKLINRALLLDNTNAHLYLAMAEAYHQKKNKEKTLFWLKKAFASKSIDIQDKTRLLYENYIIKNLDKNIPIISELLEVMQKCYPDSSRFYVAQGDIALMQQNWILASQKFEAALVLDKNNCAVWSALIRLQFNQRQFADVVRLCQEASVYCGENMFFYLMSGIADSQIGHYEDALASLKRGLDLSIIYGNTDLQIDFYRCLGDVYNALKMYRESDESYEKALAINYNTAIVLNNYAYFLSLREERLDKAQVMAYRAVQLEPENPSYRDTLAWVLFQMGDYASAEKEMKPIVHKSPNNSDALLYEHYGDILYRLGRVKEAVRYWDKALKKGGASAELERKINEKKLSN